MTLICGVTGRCERHHVDLHGYPCDACEEEYWRRHPRTRAAIRACATGVGTWARSRLSAARAADVAALAAYDGPHDTTVERAGTSGPVSHLWNALCTEGCGWSRYWARTRHEAEDAARWHRQNPKAGT